MPRPSSPVREGAWDFQAGLPLADCRRCGARNAKCSVERAPAEYVVAVTPITLLRPSVLATWTTVCSRCGHEDGATVPAALLKEPVRLIRAAWGLG